MHLNEDEQGNKPHFHSKNILIIISLSGQFTIKYNVRKLSSKWIANKQHKTDEPWANNSKTEENVYANHIIQIVCISY
jgi:hypothetical protein